MLADFFSTFNGGGTTRNRLASFNPNEDSLPTSFDPNITGGVSTLLLSSDDTTLYAGGTLTSTNGGTISRNALAAFTPGSTSTATSFNPSLTNCITGDCSNAAFALALSADNSTLYVGGDFSVVNGGTTRRSLASFTTSATGTVTSFDPDVVGNISGSGVYSLALSPDGTTIYAGGAFTSVNGGDPRNRIAGFTIGDSAATAFDPDLDSDALAIKISSSSSHIYVGGSFTTVGGNEDFLNFSVFDPSDTTAPVVTVAGDNPLYLTITNPYPEFGATATDDTDGSLAVTTDASSVDTSVAGTYTVTYSATDAALNVGSSTRSVIVNPIAGTVGVGNSISISGGGGGGGSSYTPPPSTGGTTTPADPTAALQAQISLLLKQVADLQAQIAARTGGSSVVFTKNLKLGDIDPEVKLLQIYLNTHGFIVNSTAGIGAPGSPGSETTKFGALTKAALIRFQEAHAADVLTPFGLTSGTGYFGSLTRAYVNAHP